MTHRTRIRAALSLAVAALLGGVAYGDLIVELGRQAFPTTLARTGTIAYDSSTGFLQLDAQPFRTILDSATVRQHAPDPAGVLSINSQILNPQGTSVLGVGSPHLRMEGAVDLDGNGTVGAGESGVMLTGDLVEVGKQNNGPGGGTNDIVGFRFRPTGGFMAPYYAGKNVGVEVQFPNDGSWAPAPSAGADFANSFSAAIAFASVRPIPCAVQIGDFVWNDADGDGIQDPGETGINGVTVLLKDQSGNVIASAVTQRGPFNQGGYYLFEKIDGFCAGTYQVEVDMSTVPAGFTPTRLNAPGSDASTDSNASPATVTLGSDIATEHRTDFGFRTPFDGGIGGFMWHDLNEDGVQDSGEPGIDHVTVNLYQAMTGTFVATTGTINGVFGFSGLDAGDYRVEVDDATLPRGFAPTVSNAGAPEVDSDGSPAFVTLDVDHRRELTVGFGYISVCTGVVGDYIWYDKNQDGIQDAGESGLSAVDVTLRAADDSVVATTSTGANGRYTFTGLCAGSYKVVVDPADLPAGFTPTIANTSVPPAFDSNGSPAPVSLSDDNTTNDTIDFGYAAPCTGSVGDRVWHDANSNGIQDAGEDNYAGVTVNLRRLSDNTVIQSDITGADGTYLLTGLCPGSHVIELVPPTGTTPAPSLIGANRAIDSDTNPVRVILALDDSSNNTIDFGLVCNGEIGDFVWHDANGDGAQDAGEPGIAGATVTLTDSKGRVKTRTTTSAGFYNFVGLCAGEYKVAVATPTGYQGPTILLPSKPLADSNPNPSMVVLTTSGEQNPSIDFGFVKPTPPPPPVPGIKIVKTANKHTVVFGESVTFTYVVTNTGAVPLTDIKVVDDNATPSYRHDDFTVGTVSSLAPGASKTFTAKRVPPAKMCNTDSHGNNRNCGLIITHLLGAYAKFVYLQAKDHRDDWRDNHGWWGGRSYSRKAKFRVIDKDNLNSMDVHGDLEDGDDEEFESAFSVTVAKSYVSSNDDWVSAPKIYHKKGWDNDWRDDFDRRFGDLFRFFRWDDDKWDRDNDRDYDYDKHPKQCPTISTNIATVTAKAGDKTLKETDKETVQVVAPAVGAPYKTYTQGGWGAKPSGNNPGHFLSSNFSKVYTGGYVTIGSTKTVKLTSASAIEKFLPQGGSPTKLTQNYINPTSQITVLAGQVLALKLNVDFSAKGLTRKGLGNLTVVSGELAGRTVSQILTIANNALGGGSLPSGVTYSELNDILAKINENFDGGTQNNGYLRD